MRDDDENNLESSLPGRGGSVPRAGWAVKELRQSPSSAITTQGTWDVNALLWANLCKNDLPSLPSSTLL